MRCDDFIGDVRRGLADDTQATGDAVEREVVVDERGKVLAFDIARDAGGRVEDILDAEAPLPRWHEQPRRKCGRAVGV